MKRDGDDLPDASRFVTESCVAQSLVSGQFFRHFKESGEKKRDN